MKSHDVLVEGVRLHVVEEGEGEPILFLHGWGATVKFWRDAFAALSPGHRCIAFDWPGFGGSEKPDAPYTIEWYAVFVGKVMDALGLESAALVGHSMGGAAAARFALDHPERVRKLGMVNALVRGPTAFSLLKRLASLPVIRRLVWLLAHIRCFRRLAARMFAYAVRLSDEIIDDAISCTFHSAFRSITSMKRFDIAPDLPRLRGPTLVVNTDHDRVFKPSQFEIQRDSIPNPVVAYIQETGHCPMVERPEEFNRALTSFFNGRS